jgi:hypothetical protein
MPYNRQYQHEGFAKSMWDDDALTHNLCACVMTAWPPDDVIGLDDW